MSMGMADRFAWLCGAGGVAIGYSHGADIPHLIVMALAGCCIGAVVGFIISPD